MSADGVIAGVDLGGTKIQAVVLRGETVIGSARSRTPRDGRADDVVAALAGAVKDALGQADVPAAELVAVGVGAPGAVDPTTGTVAGAANVPGFEGRVALGPLLSGALGGVPVVVENDANAGAVGEHRQGAGRPYGSLLGVWVGTGVGGGLILDGKLWRGRGAAGELGHVVVEHDGRLCTCGRRGCLEAYAGRVGLERRAKKLVKDGQRTRLYDIMERRGRERLTSGVFARALEEKDPLARRLVDDAARALGIALASVQNLLDLDAIVVGGGLGDRLGQPFVDQILEEMTPRLFVRDDPPPVVLSELLDLACAVGAADLAGNRHPGGSREHVRHPGEIDA
jgi:glucokinase